MTLKNLRYVVLRLSSRQQEICKYTIYSNKKERFEGEQRFKSLFRNNYENPDSIRIILRRQFPMLIGSRLTSSKFITQIIDGEEQESKRVYHEEFII